jgi:hypothetical protein
MLHRRPQKSVTTDQRPGFADLHEWVLSLPWVVERPYSLGTPGARTFAIDCEPLGRRQLWLLTGLQGQVEVDGMGIAVIVPREAAAEIEGAGWGRSVAPMPAHHVMVTVYGDAVGCRQDIEALVLTAYGYAMS